MISYEILRIIRNPKCKYGLLIALGTFAFHSQMQQFLTSQYSSISFTMLVVFLFLLLFYQIAWEEEQPHCWKSILAYPKSYRRNYIGKFLALLLFQIPVAGIGILFYYSLESTVSIAFLRYLLCFQCLYFTGFFYSCFKTSKGYLSTMGTITVFNITKRMTPLFLLFCIFNEKQWANFFFTYWQFVLCFCILVLIGLCIALPYCMRRKLYREMVLSKMFPNLKFTPMQLQAMRYKNTADNLLQKLFIKLDNGKASYWPICAALEVTLKLHLFPLLLFFFFFIWYLQSFHILLLVAMSVCLFSFFYYLKKERDNIKKVYIYTEK